MKRKHKRKPIARRRFIIKWVLVWYLSFYFLPPPFNLPTMHFNFVDFPVLVITRGIALGVLAIFQIIVVRRCLHIELRHWLSLALLGFVVGQIGLHFLEMNVVRPFPPAVIQLLKEPESAAWFRYALYSIVWGFLHWYTPLAFQWLALWKRFRHHGLWLLAAVMAAPLHFIVTEHGGILGHAVDLLEHLTGFSLMNLPVVLLDWATPTIMMGLVLQYLVVKNNAFQRQVCQSA